MFEAYRGVRSASKGLAGTFLIEQLTHPSPSRSGSKYLTIHSSSYLREECLGKVSLSTHLTSSNIKSGIGRASFPSILSRIQKKQPQASPQSHGSTTRAGSTSREENLKAVQCSISQYHSHSLCNSIEIILIYSPSDMSPRSNHRSRFDTMQSTRKQL
jgi:hypothetical protein